MTLPRILRSLLPITLVVVIGCAGPSRTTHDAAGFDDVRRLVEARNARIIALSGEGRISIDTPDMGNSGGIGVQLVKPDSLKIDITGPFGVGVARGLVTAQHFTFYNSLDNTVIEGTTTARNLRQVLRFPIEFADVLEVLTGTVGFRAAPAASPVVQSDGDVITAVYTTGDGTLEYVIDLGYEAVTRFTRRNAAGEQIETLQFKDFRKKSGLYMPQVVSVSRPLNEESLMLVYDRATLNNPPLDFTFKVPRSATKISF